jgi:NadR type nicotinamide-nucleotide adenylyltransferase
MPLKKIVVIGPESTGKSTLCEALAKHFRSEWVREYAREWLSTYGKQYSYEDLSTIARGQLALEDKAAAAEGAAIADRAATADGAAAERFLFIDTDLYVIKVWSEYVFGRCETWILEEIARRDYNAYLLCCTDLPWAAEELREYPDQETRDRLFHIYKDLLVNQNIPWAEIRGTAGQRLEHAIAAVERLTERTRG